MPGVQDRDSASTSNPLPIPIANVDAPPPFLSKTYDVVDDPSTNSIVSWGSNNNSFVVWNQAEFEKLLPKYFKHNNFSSFVRQLNTYGFRKVDPDRLEFANEKFLRGQKHLLRRIIRKKSIHGQNDQQPQQQLNIKSTTPTGACVEVGKFGLEEEVDRLKRDKNVLMQELVRLRQQQQATDNQLQTMVQHLQGMEQRQQQMMSFLAKAVQSPGFLAQFVQQQTESNRRVTEGNKKRRLKEENNSESEQRSTSADASDGQIVKYQPPINDATTEMFMQMLSENGSSPRRVSGVTLQEVPPISGQLHSPADSNISDCALDFSPSVPLPQSDAMKYEVTEVPKTIPEDILEIFEDDDEIFMDSSPGVTVPNALDIDDICYEDTDIDGLVGDDHSNFWEQLLAGIPDEIGPSSFDDLSIMSNNETIQQSENVQEKIEPMDDLTEQMGLLTPNSEAAQ